MQVWQSFKNAFVPACLNFALDSGDLFCWYKWKSDFYELWRWVRLHLILTIRDIYINSNLKPLTKFISNSRRYLKGIFPWNISQMIIKTIRITTRIVMRYTIKQDILFWVWWKVNGNSDNNMIRISKGGKGIVEQILVPEDRNKYKTAGPWESQSGVGVAKLTIWVRSFKIEKL